MKIFWILLAGVLLFAAYKWYKKTQSNAIDESSEAGENVKKDPVNPEGGASAQKVMVVTG